ncbi:paraplegin-like [Varroa jacobsoni]|uniref:paraplegin-like n=1 Tax=Varroa jacobsoni TaxID=62625 RepID=UPI000BF2DDBE|nr:paraplegin-like [Varroa jacobsoni]
MRTKGILLARCKLHKIVKMTTVRRNLPTVHALLVNRPRQRIVGLSLATYRRLHLEIRAAEQVLNRSFPTATVISSRLLRQVRSYSWQQSPNDESVNRSGGGDEANKKNASRSTGSEKENNPNGDKDDDDQNRLRRIAVTMVMISLALTLVLPILMRTNNVDDMGYVAWNDFYHNMLAKGEVEEVVVLPDLELALIYLHRGAIIKGQPTGRRVYQMKIVDLEQFESRIRQAERQLGVTPGSVPVKYDRQNPIFNWIIILGVIYFIIRALRKAGGGKGGKMSPFDMFGQMGRVQFTVVDHSINSTKPKVRFSDVAGCHGAKQELAEFIDYLQDSSKYKKLGATMPKGVLLLGPPGTGKTMLAKAVAAEAKVPFLAMAGSEFIEMVGGLGAARVRNLFKEARKRSPCIIYIDEIDAVGRKRHNSKEGAGGESEQTLNQLLVEMDGMATKEGVLMLASTNRADILDKALLRPGRFDRHIVIDLPNLAERIEIYEKHLGDIVLDSHPSVYSKRLAELTPGFSGADIANVCNEAALHAAREKKRSVGSGDIEYAVERVVGGTEKKTHAMSPEERQRVAVHECGHALVAWLMEQTDALLKISIVPRTKGALGMARYVPSEQYLYTTEQLFQKICMALGGRAAEVIVYGQPSTGAQDDLKKVTDIAKAIVEQYGMDNTIGPLSYTERKPYSKKLANNMDHRIWQLVQHAYNTTIELIRKNSDKLKLLSEELVKKEVMDYKDVEAILGPRPHGQKPPYAADSKS